MSGSLLCAGMSRHIRVLPYPTLPTPGQAPTGSAARARVPQFCSLNTYARAGGVWLSRSAMGARALLGAPPAVSSRTPSPDNASVRANVGPLHRMRDASQTRSSLPPTCSVEQPPYPNTLPLPLP